MIQIMNCQVDAICVENFKKWNEVGKKTDKTFLECEVMK